MKDIKLEIKNIKMPLPEMEAIRKRIHGNKEKNKEKLKECLNDLKRSVEIFTAEKIQQSLGWPTLKYYSDFETVEILFNIIRQHFPVSNKHKMMFDYIRKTTVHSYCDAIRLYLIHIEYGKIPYLPDRINMWFYRDHIWPDILERCKPKKLRKATNEK